MLFAVRRFLKLGCIEDIGNHKRITPRLRLYTSKSEEFTSLDENMGENQKAIYYLATELEEGHDCSIPEKLVEKCV
ncbi:hypothetical protein MLD38_005372 [Melastoma candidum]|uniref:Uncharacterized protein n=1 Tax=Melastoma candidum TaxID=119954 RepID=A0ACB9SBW6_9MYRT|nr:hypothetical protein MLD38_005372 [Melastoma candidum]